MLALLGPNGAGKTTLVRILTTLLRPDAGIARVDGLDVVADAARLRPLIGLAGQYAAVDELLKKSIRADSSRGVGGRKRIVEPSRRITSSPTGRRVTVMTRSSRSSYGAASAVARAASAENYAAITLSR